MEGSGFWDSLPCIIIKRVSDTQTVTRIKIGQNFACATAASAMNLPTVSATKYYKQGRHNHTMTYLIASVKQTLPVRDSWTIKGYMTKNIQMITGAPQSSGYGIQYQELPESNADTVCFYIRVPETLRC